ncbi:MAG: BamA/TamA family outer membrane protein [Candidatus Zixiibacteriota bacterium]
MRLWGLILCGVTSILVLWEPSAAIEKETLRWVRSKNPPIGKIVIEGNTYFQSGEIKKRMYAKERGLWRAIKGDRRARVQRETASRDSLEIKYMYLREGFLNVVMDEDYEPMGKDSSALVRIRISEGRQFRFGARTVIGEFESRFKGDIEGTALRLKEGIPIDLFRLRDAVFTMKSILANNGYPHAVVDYAVDSTAPGPLYPVTFKVDARWPVRFGEVKIDGLSRFPDYVARRELKVKPGAVYRRQDIIDSQQRLYESGYFSTLQLGVDPEDRDSLQPGFILRVRERKSRYVTLKTGAAQSTVRDLQWDTSVGFGKRNFIGSRVVDATSQYSFSLGSETRLLDHRYRLRFTEPWFLGVRMPLVLTGEVRPEVQSAKQDYRISSWSVSASTGRKFGREYSTQLGVQYESVNITGIPADQVLVAIQEAGVSGRRKLYWNFQRDSRENIFIPERGSLFLFSAQYVGGFLGGDANFTTYEAAYSSYQVVWPGWISATRLKGGWAEAFGKSTLVPREDRLYLGGANTVRGFRENTLGPTDGANVTAVFNQEFRWKSIQVLNVVPLLGDLFKAMPLWQSVFVDIGNGFSTWDEFKLKDLAYSYGTGVQLVSPAGPIRVDYARVIPTERFQFTSRWHFTILYAF